MFRNRIVPQKLLLACACLAALAPAMANAASYQLKMSTHGLTVQPTFTLSLAQGALPEALQGSSYSFSLAQFVAVSGDPTFSADKATFTATGLPNYLSLSPAGLLAGAPTASGQLSFQVSASYKGQTRAQTYFLNIAAMETIKQFSGYKSWSDGTLAQSCNEYRQGKTGYAYVQDTGDGIYRIQPAGEASPANVYCDMTTNGGGYTVISSVSGTTMSPVVWAQASATNPPLPSQGNASYLPSSLATKLAALSSEVLIKRANTTNMLYSTSTSVMANLRAGKVANYSDGALDQTSLWAMSSPGLTQLNTKCASNDASAGSTGASRYPSIFWGCGNTSALHVTRNISATQGLAGFTSSGGLQMVVMYR